MTAINEQGQVYWTFEELDLVGAYKEVNALQEKYSLLFTHYIDLTKSKLNDKTWLFDDPICIFIESQQRYYDELADYYHSIRRNISNLMTSDEFVDGGCHLV
jgi:hypothetical protein